MPEKNRSFVSVDELIEQTSLDAVLDHYGLPLTQRHAREYRMNCVFNESCVDSSYGNLAVQLDAAKLIFCHSCRVRGNLLTLLHGLDNNCPPESGRLRGAEFRAAVTKLKEIVGQESTPQNPGKRNAAAHSAHQPERQKQVKEPHSPEASANQSSAATTERSPTPKNTPMWIHEKEAVRALEDLFEDLITDRERMSPAANEYLESRPWLTPELMQKWRCGWIPGNGRSLFRKNYFVYTHRNVGGEVISYSGRDLKFEQKWQRWIKDGRPQGKKPSKHRYVTGFHRGIELYGAMSSRLEETDLVQSLDTHGLVVVEGMNDVIRLDALGICAVGICSNRATETQANNIAKFAQQVANSRVLLFPDPDPEGEAGFKELLWQLAQSGIQTSVAPNPDRLQPEETNSPFWASDGR